MLKHNALFVTNTLFVTNASFAASGNVLNTPSAIAGAGDSKSLTTTKSSLGIDSMKQYKHKLASALILGLVMTLGAGKAVADDPDTDRVWVKFKSGNKAQVQQALRGAGGRIHHALDGLDAFAASVPTRALQGLRHNPNIEYIEADAPRYPSTQVQPYGVGMVQAPQVWATGTTGSGITVCVIDSGVHRSHEDFQGVNFIGGYPSNWSTDTCGHGSHVAGTIAAANNDQGVVGVNTGDISLYIDKVFDGPSCGWSYSSDLVDAANHCADAGARVINMSLGGSFSSTTERNAFQGLYDRGILSIAAAGNAGDTSFSYPASYDSVISVAAVDQSKALAAFSQRNNQVELAAPGVGVLSTVSLVSATTAVDRVSYMVMAMEYTHDGATSGALVDGGLCDSVGSWTGKVVLCERGSVSFAMKVNNVYAGGGAAAIVYNNAPGGFSGSLGSAGRPIPALSMAGEDGEYLIANKIGAIAEVSTIPTPGDGYAYYDGTSMASPHVAGVAALIWSAKPTWANQQIREALATTAEDLGAAGLDTSYGWGLISAKAALDELNGALPGDVPPAQLTASRIKVRGKTTSVRLGWTSGTAAEVDLYRDGIKRGTLANDGNHDEMEVGQRHTVAVYKLCIKDSTTACSNEASVRF